MAFFEDLKTAIPAYTGLSPVSFFTVCALLFALYYLVSGFFAAPKHNFPSMEPLPPPVQLGDVTEKELSAYNGEDSQKPLLMAIKGQIYDVSQSRMFYGPGGPYALFAGKDASRALAKMSFEEQDLTGDVEGLSASELDALQDWEWKFNSKYVKVGQIVTENGKPREVPVTDGPSIPENGTTREVPMTDGPSIPEGSENVDFNENVDSNGVEDRPNEESAKEE